MSGKRIGLLSPYGAKTQEKINENIEFIKKFARRVVLDGNYPYISHLVFPQFLDDNNPQERELGLMAGLAFLELCHEVWVCGDIISNGMKQELEYLEKLGGGMIPVKFKDLRDLREESDGE